MIKKLDNDKLHLATKTAARSEKTATIVLLEHLHEISLRKLFIDYGHSTLHKYVVKELGYSEAESWTRIHAMKVLEKAPEARESIVNGELSLVNAAIIYQQIRNQKDPDEIKKTIDNAKGKSSRKLQDEISGPSSRKIILSQRLLQKIEKLGWELSEVEVFEALLDEKIKIQELSKGRGRADESKVSRYIPIETKREVLERSGHKCEHEGGCNERRNLQWDHIKPYALGGDRSAKNIRLLCFGHNQRRAIKTFGLPNLKFDVAGTRPYSTPSPYLSSS